MDSFSSEPGGYRARSLSLQSCIRRLLRSLTPGAPPSYLGRDQGEFTGGCVPYARGKAYLNTCCDQRSQLSDSHRGLAVSGDEAKPETAHSASQAYCRFIHPLWRHHDKICIYCLCYMCIELTRFDRKGHRIRITCNSLHQRANTFQETTIVTVIARHSQHCFISGLQGLSCCYYAYSCSAVLGY